MVSPGDRPSKDLTLRARIRDAAMHLFAEKGFAGTSFRMVAEAAGVSTGAVQHHFSAKEALRQACDDHAIGTLLDTARSALADSGGQPGFRVAMYGGNELGTRYLARAMVDGSPAAAALFDAGAELAEEWMAATSPQGFADRADRVRDAAAVMSAMHLGTIVLHEHLSRRMQADVLGQAHRIAAGMVDVYTVMADFLASPQGSELFGIVRGAADVNADAGQGAGARDGDGE